MPLRTAPCRRSSTAAMAVWQPELEEDGWRRPQFGGEVVDWGRELVEKSPAALLRALQQRLQLGYGSAMADLELHGAPMEGYGGGQWGEMELGFRKRP
uniref:Gdh1 n=1 Tax=Arundo donax TaxID=35708 RepID=A0A0A9CK97_ARUDO